MKSLAFFILSLSTLFAFLTPAPVPAQLTFTKPSRLGDSLYVERQIKDISDRDLFNSLRLETSPLWAVTNAEAKGDVQKAYEAWGTYWRSEHQPKYITQNYHLLLDTDLLMSYDQLRSYAEQYPEERDTILTRAAMILQNRIRVWGDVVIEFGKRVDFNTEVGQSGKYGFHYWIWSRPLNAAYVLTGDQKYLAQFDELFNQWYEQRNSITRRFPELDVVYYELGLGVRNRMFIEHYLMPYERRTWKTHERVLKTILGAARWLYELEKWEGYRPGNWQSHGSYMLAQIALVFPEFRESNEWLSIALQRIEEHLKQDFFEDGGHSERSPRNYTMATYLTYRNLYYLLNAYHVDEAFANVIQSTTGRTIDWWLTMMTPLGETPAINDSHRALFPAYVLQDGAEIFKKPEAYGVLKSLLGIQIDEPAALPSFTSRHMPASGFTVMRTDWTREALYMTINYGKFAGFHTHNDMLDLEVYAYGKALAVDAGIGLTYDDPLYIPWYQSSRAHNMVVVNEHNIERKGIEGENIVWSSSPSLDYFAGEHRGYEQLGVRQRRHIAFVKPTYWVILDRLTSTKSGDTLSWYVHSPTRLVKKGNGYQSSTAPGVLILPAVAGLTSRVGKGMAASTEDPTPGETQQIDWIAFDQISKVDSTQEFPILLFPYRSTTPAIKFISVSPQHFVLAGEGFADDLYFPTGRYHDAEISTDATFLIRHQESGRASFALANATYLDYRGKRIWSSVKKTSVDRIVVH